MNPNLRSLERIEELTEALTKRRPVSLPDIPLPAGWKALGMSTPFALWAVNIARELRVGVSEAIEVDGRRWRHVSASKPKRVPNYEEMCLVKNIFVGEDMEAYSVWAPKARHVNIHPYCLHFWCPVDGPVLPDFSSGGIAI